MPLPRVSVFLGRRT